MVDLCRLGASIVARARQLSVSACPDSLFRECASDMSRGARLAQTSRLLRLSRSFMRAVSTLEMRSLLLRRYAHMLRRFRATPLDFSERRREFYASYWEEA